MVNETVRKKKISITRRIDADLWAEVLEFARSFPLHVTDTAIIEAALRDYLEAQWERRSEKMSEKC